MTAEIQSLASPADSTRWQDLRAFFIRYFDIIAMVALALIAGAYALQYDILRQPIPHDTTYHIYAAQQILENHPIYRDVGIIKAPLSDFASALAILIARAIRISDIMGTRLMSLSVVMATASVTYLAGKTLFRSRAVGILAGLLMAGWNFFGLRAVTGPEPKAFVILFSLLALIWIAQRRWGWAGIAASLATLSWQPALLIAAIAVFAAFVAPWYESRRGTTSNVRTGLQQAGRVLLGFAGPLAVLVLYLVVNNAMLAAYNAAIGANVTHFNNTQARVPLFQTVDENFAEILEDSTLYCFSASEYYLVGLGILGFIGVGATQIISGVRSKRLPFDLHLTPMLLFGLGFYAFTLIDFDYCPDLFPFLPILALTAGWLAYLFARQVASLLTRLFMGSRAAEGGSAAGAAPGRRMYHIVFAVVTVAIAFLFLLDTRGYRVTATSFLDQLEVTQAASKYLEPGDRVLTFGNALVLIELRKENATKILHLGSKSGLGVLVSEPGGVDGMMAALEADPPKLISLARENRPDWTASFYDWLDRNYEQVEFFPKANMRLLVRKE